MHCYLSLISWTCQLTDIECSQLKILQLAFLSQRDIPYNMQLGLTQRSFSVLS